jgi:hypothetical protein
MKVMHDKEKIKTIFGDESFTSKNVESYFLQNNFDVLKTKYKDDIKFKMIKDLTTINDVDQKILEMIFIYIHEK